MAKPKPKDQAFLGQVGSEFQKNITNRRWPLRQREADECRLEVSAVGRAAFRHGRPTQRIRNRALRNHELARRGRDCEFRRGQLQRRRPQRIRWALARCRPQPRPRRRCRSRCRPKSPRPSLSCRSIAGARRMHPESGRPRTWSFRQEEPTRRAPPRCPHPCRHPWCSNPCQTTSCHRTQSSGPAR